jgi:hypothetical protein
MLNNLLKKKFFQQNINKKKILNQKLENFYKLNKKNFKKQLKKIQNLKSIFKFYIKLQKKKFLLKIKKKKKKLKKCKFTKKKKLDLFSKNFLLNTYSLLNIIKLRKSNKNLNFFKKKYLLFININSNNIFINFLCYKNKKIKIIKFWSCGFLKLHCTKRKLKFIIYTLLKEIKKKIKYISFYIIKIFCAPFLHKYLYKNFKKLYFRSKFIIFTSFKIFNGCRSKKKRRKKHLKFRILR